MKFTIRFLGLVLITLVSVSFTAKAQTVDVPGVHISNTSQGAVVNVPGVSINAPAAPAPQNYGAAPVAQPAPMVVVAPTASSTAAASYVNAKLPGMDFSHKNLSDADFTNSTLSGSSFSGSILTGAHFSNANLTNADFSGARLTGADLTNANLSGANLTNADFSNADLTNVRLDGALATGARFDGAILTNVDMGKLVRGAPAVVVAPAPRPVFVDAGAISTALQTPEKKIDLNINFDFNSDKLTASGAKQVEQVAAALKDQSLAGNRIMIEGHTDNVGGEKYNKDLSYHRATRVQQVLIDQYGIDPARLSAQGFGKTRPVASNDNDLGRAMNRRVTIVNLGR